MCQGHYHPGKAHAALDRVAGLKRGLDRCKRAVDGTLTPIQAALEACDAVQCGMCFPGMVVTLTHLLRTKPGATRDDIRSALTGNICRCTGYERIVEAALLAVTANDRGRIHV